MRTDGSSVSRFPRRVLPQPDRVPRAVERKVVQSGEEITCEICGKPVQLVEPQVMRLRHGTVSYGKRGAQFRGFPDETPYWIHKACLIGRSVMDYEFQFEKCLFCGEQFYPEEGVVEFVAGEFSWRPGEPEPYFSEVTGGHGHWACSCDYSGLPIDLGDD